MRLCGRHRPDARSGRSRSRRRHREGQIRRSLSSPKRSLSSLPARERADWESAHATTARGCGGDILAQWSTTKATSNSRTFRTMSRPLLSRESPRRSHSSSISSVRCSTVLADGHDWKVPDASEAVADRLGLSDEARCSRCDPDACLFENRVRWAFTNLSKAELAELVGPSTVRITDDGQRGARLGKADRPRLPSSDSSELCRVARRHGDRGAAAAPRTRPARPSGWCAPAAGVCTRPQFVGRAAAIVGWGETGDVSGVRARRSRIASVRRSRLMAPASAGQATNTLYHLVYSMQSGDLVVTPEPASRTLLLGRVSGPYRHLDDPIAPNYETRARRSVVRTRIARRALIWRPEQSWERCSRSAGRDTRASF